MKKSIYQYSLKRTKVMEFRENETLSRPQNAFRFLKAIRLHEEEQENLVVLVLDVKNCVKAYYTVCIGLIDTSPSHSREVFRQAIISGASRIILAHNHPSGSTQPSSEDIKTTDSMVKAGKIIGIEILDHIIIGNGYYSFREAGKLEAADDCNS